MSVDTMAAVFLPFAAEVSDDGQRGGSPGRSGSLVRWCFRSWSRQ
ncbi:hypothetical protein ACFXPA_22265 [Amycolatopsis sp. NPDC059090]